MTPLIDLDNKTEIEAADALPRRLAVRAIAMVRTCTSEHGVGHKKRDTRKRSMGRSPSTSAARQSPVHPQNLGTSPGKVLDA